MANNTCQFTLNLSPKHPGNLPSVITPSAVITAIEKRPNALTAELMSGVGNTCAKSSSALPYTTLSYRLEKQINKLLQDNDAGLKITIRSFSHEKQKYFGRYRYRVIIAFQAIEGADVAFFIVYALESYEHGKEPSIKIEFIDSVKYFQPGDMRTALYQEIIIAYLDYARNIGFKEANLYSCAPDGQEYIFNARPKHQLEPTQERLNEWYKVLFGEAEERSIVHNIKYSTKDMTREMDITMDLRKTDNDPHQEENLSCPSVEYYKLTDFFCTDNGQKFRFSTLAAAHHATQALLNNMFTDIGIHSGTNSFSIPSNIHSTQSSVPSQSPPLSMSHSSTTPNSVSASGLSGIAKILQLRQKFKSHQQKIASRLKKPPVPVHSAVRTKRPASSSTGQQPASKKSRSASGALQNVPAKPKERQENQVNRRERHEARRKERKEEQTTLRRSRRIKMQSQPSTSI